MLEDADAWHTSELAFCFDNTARCAQGMGTRPEAQVLARRMATAWANFAPARLARRRNDRQHARARRPRVAVHRHLAPLPRFEVAGNKADFPCVLVL